MSQMIDYYYGMLSPYAFLGHERLVALAARHGAAIEFKPTDFIGRVFARTGGLKLHERHPARQAYRLMELRRWSDYLGVKLNLHPKHFPVPDELAARFAIAVGMAGGDIGAFSLGVLRAVWQEERDVSDPRTLLAIAGDLGLDGAALLRAAEGAETLARLETNCNEAVARGVFGTPTYVLGDELFWGQDRLDFLERALAGRAA